MNSTRKGPMKRNVNSTKTKPRNPKLNVRLLRRIQKHILAEPLRIDMGEFVKTKYFDEVEQPPCGTTACIAGWALILSGAKPQSVYNMLPENIARRAATLLGIKYVTPSTSADWWHSPTWNDSDSQAVKLFDGEQWPERFSNRLDLAMNAMHDASSRAQVIAVKRRMARVTADRIEHLIKTGE